jgi:5-methylcytosine-specific restriction endonuclease McrA
MSRAPIAPLSADAALQRRCRQALSSHRKRAEADHVKLAYGLAELLAVARATTQCVYCHAPLSFGFHFDHRAPVARTTQAHRIENLVCCCADCNMLKGQMDGEEFRRLLSLLAGFHPQAATDVRRRMIAGGARYAASRRRTTSPAK